MRKNEIDFILTNVLCEIQEHEILFVNPSIDNGTMGLAQLYFYYNAFYGEREYLDRGFEMIQKSILNLSEISNSGYYESMYKGDSLSNAIASFGKGLLFTENKWSLGVNFRTYYNQLNEVLSEVLTKELQCEDFDYFSGALASGHYFLNHYQYYKDEYSKKSLISIYNQLQESAQRNSDNQIYWVSRSFGNRTYLGLSHGSAMIINFISKMFEVGILTSEPDKSFLKSAIDFVLSKERPKEPYGFFPDIYNEGIVDSRRTQFAMCYGDLGILFALFSASTVLNDRDLQTSVGRMLSSYLTSALDRTLTYDAGILYGASGVYWIFREVCEKWNLNGFTQRKDYWYNQILHFRTEGTKDNAGFLDIFKNVQNNTNKPSKYSFLWGLAGVAITLIAGQDDGLPKVNELTLLGI